MCARENNINVHELSAKLRVVSGLINLIIVLHAVIRAVIVWTRVPSLQYFDV